MGQSITPIRLCYLPVCFSKSAGWVLLGSTEHATKAASGNRCAQRCSVRYDGQPDVSVKVGLEVLRLAQAHDLPKLAGEIEAGILACLDSSVALQVLQEAHGLHSLRDACEDKVAEEFETCSQHPDFAKLTASQLARILKREDLGVSREEAVVSAVFTWNKVSKDGGAFLCVLLQHVHFNSLSIENLLRLGHTTLSGPSGDDLHREVEGALTSQKRTQSPGAFQSKRHRFQHWSPFFGASTEASRRQVLSLPCISLCWHQGELFAARFSSKSSILCWKRGDPPTCSAVMSCHLESSCAIFCINLVYFLNFNEGLV